MFWDKVSGFYDFFETIYNGKVYQGLGERVAEEIEQKSSASVGIGRGKF